MKRILSAFLAFLFLIVLSRKTNAQKISVDVDYDVVNVNDTIMLRYTITGNKDSIKAFIEPELKMFNKISGPHQSNTSSTSIINGVMKQTEAIYIIYILSVKSKGILTAEPAKITLKDGRTLTSATISITVNEKQAPIHETKNAPLINSFKESSNRNDWSKNFNLLFDQTTFERIQENIDASQKKYLLITGWIYRDRYNKRRTDSISAAINHYLKAQTNIRILDSFKDDNMPRFYYALDDTAFIRKQLEPFYQRAGLEGKPAIIISIPQEWGIQMEMDNFEALNASWQLIYDLMKEDSFFKTPAANKVAQLQIRFSFKDSTNLELLAGFAQSKGYKVMAANAPADYKGDFIFADFIKPTYMNEDAIFKTINTLNIEARKRETFFDNIYGLGIYSEN